MGKHSARAERTRFGSAAAAPGTGRRRAPEGQGPTVHGRAPEAVTPVPGPGSGRRRGAASGTDAAELAADFDAGFAPGRDAGPGYDAGPGFDAGFGPDYDAGYSAGLGSGAGPGAGPGQEEAARPSARSGHPEQREPVLGWGVIGAQRDRTPPAAPTAPAGHTHSATGYMSGLTPPAARRPDDDAGPRP
ncbi:hypothetical protein LE181_31240, partial [Streptomyces sp. SCA3-4]|nr:hypothetical protein [Streptomyces sichuanensis]